MRVLVDAISTTTTKDVTISPAAPKKNAPTIIKTRQNFIAYENSMLGCVNAASATTAMHNIVCGMNQPDSILNSPRINAPMTESDAPSELGVFSDASFRPSTAISSRMNCQKIGIAKSSAGTKKLKTRGVNSSYSAIR